MKLASLKSKSLKKAVKLLYLKDDHVISVLNEASKKFWPGELIQETLEHIGNAFKQRIHELLASLGELKSIQRYWTTYIKETSAFMKAFETWINCCAINPSSNNHRPQEAAICARTIGSVPNLSNVCAVGGASLSNFPLSFGLCDWARRWEQENIFVDLLTR